MGGSGATTEGAIIHCIDEEREEQARRAEHSQPLGVHSGLNRKLASLPTRRPQLLQLNAPKTNQRGCAINSGNFTSFTLVYGKRREKEKGGCLWGLNLASSGKAVRMFTL